MSDPHRAPRRTATGGRVRVALVGAGGLVAAIVLSPVLLHGGSAQAAQCPSTPPCMVTSTSVLDSSTVTTEPTTSTTLETATTAAVLATTTTEGADVAGLSLSRGGGDSSLPVTGADIAGMAGIATVALAAGGGFVIAGRRRRSHDRYRQ